MVRLDPVEVKTYPENTEIISQRLDFQSLTRSGEQSDTFVRRVDPWIPKFTLCSLGRILAVADNELEHVAALCHAEVVPHTWGIVSKQIDSPNYRTNRKIPRDYSLVAEVDRVITYGPVPVPLLEAVVYGLKNYRRGIGPYRKLVDMHLGQFMFGNLTANLHETPRLFLVDIEPRF